MTTTERPAQPKLTKGQKFTLKCLRIQRTGKNRGKKRVTLLAVSAEERAWWDDEHQAWCVGFEVPDMSYYARYDAKENVWYEGSLTEEKIEEVLEAQREPSAL